MSAAPKQQEIREPVKHDGYPDSHNPPHSERDCSGCDGARKRRRANWRAARTLGIKGNDQPAKQCKGCSVPVFAGMSGAAPVWAWNQNPDRQTWSIEPRPTPTAHTFCQRCRAANKEP